MTEPMWTDWTGRGRRSQERSLEHISKGVTILVVLVAFVIVTLITILYVLLGT